jgi:hypothetical protein
MRQLLLLSLLPFAAASHAANYCVTSGAGFRDALVAAAQSGDADQIRFVRGAIALDGPVDAGIKIEGSLQLRGGYAAGCESRLDPKHVSRIDGNGFDIRMLLRRASNLDVEQMHFHGLERFTAASNVAETAGIYGVIRITRSAFREFGHGPVFDPLRHDVRISNSLFADNEWGVSLASYYNVSAGLSSRVEVVNSTLVNNGVGLVVHAGSTGVGATPPSIVNSIVADNLDADLSLAQSTIVRYSLYRVLELSGAGALHANSQSNLGGAPMLDSRFVPRAGSPALDSGDDSVIGYPFIPPDFAVNLRKVGAHVDRGALEKQATPVFPFP